MQRKGPVTPRKEGTEPWLYEILHALAIKAASSETGLAAVVRGEVPDGSGAPLLNLSDYFYLPGKVGGQVANGSTQTSGFLRLHSTAATTKGKIYLGLASAYDEANVRLGLGTTSPSAVLHLAQSGALLYNRPTSDTTIGTWRSQPGTGITNLFSFFDDVVADDTDYISQGLGSGSSTGSFGMGAPAFLSGTPTATLRVRARTMGGSGTYTFEYQLYRGGFPILASSGNILTTSFTTLSHVLSGTELADLFAASGDLNVFLTGSGGPPVLGLSDAFEVSWVELEWSSSGVQDLVQLYTAAGVTLTSKIDQAAKLGIGTGSDTLTAHITGKASDAAAIVFRAQGAASQSGNLFEAVNSSSVVLGSFTGDGYLSSRRLLLNGATSGRLTIIPAAATTSHTWNLPAAQGGAGTFFKNDGSGNLSWALIAETDIVDGALLARVAADETISGNWDFAGGGRAVRVLSGNIGSDDGTGFAIWDGVNHTRIAANPSLAGSIEVTLPSATTTLVGISDTATLTNKRFGGGCVIFNSPGSAFTLFGKGSSTTLGMLLDLTNIATSNKTWAAIANLSGALPLVSNSTTVAAGSLTKIDSGTKTADIASANLSSTPPAGQYQINYTLETVATDGTAGSVTVTFAWTGASALTKASTPLVLTAAGQQEGTFPITLVSGNIAYSTAHTGIYGTASYKLTIRVVALG